MSSPATIVASSEHAQPSSTLLIIPDGRPLWTEPGSGSGQVVWQSNAITTLMKQLKVSNFPILIGAASHTASELLNGRFDGGLACDDHFTRENLAVLPRFVNATHATECIGSTDPEATRVQLWFVPRDTFGYVSDGWSSTLRRLGFKTPRWRGQDSLLDNLQERRVSNVVTAASRPSAIAVGRLVDNKLLTTNYDLGS